MLRYAPQIDIRGQSTNMAPSNSIFKIPQMVLEMKSSEPLEGSEVSYDFTTEWHKNAIICTSDIRLYRYLTTTLDSFTASIARASEDVKAAAQRTALNNARVRDRRRLEEKKAATGPTNFPLKKFDSNSDSTRFFFKPTISIETGGFFRLDNIVTYLGYNDALSSMLPQGVHGLTLSLDGLATSMVGISHALDAQYE